MIDQADLGPSRLDQPGASVDRHDRAEGLDGCGASSVDRRRRGAAPAGSRPWAPASSAAITASRRSWLPVHIDGMALHGEREPHA